MVLEAGDGEGSGLGGASGGGDDVGSSGAAFAKIAGGVVLETLRGGIGVDGGHHGFLDAKIVLEDFHDGGDAVGGAGGVGKYLVVGGHDFFVDAENDGLDAAALGGGGENNLAGASSEVLLRVGELAEGAGTLQNGVDFQFAPRELRGVRLAEKEDFAVVDDDVLIIVADFVIINTVSGIVFEEMSEGFGIAEAVDSDDVCIVALKSNLESAATNAPESVDS